MSEDVADTHASSGATHAQVQGGPTAIAQDLTLMKQHITSRHSLGRADLEQAQHALSVINLCHRQMQVLLKCVHDPLPLLRKMCGETPSPKEEAVVGTLAAVARCSFPHGVPHTNGDIYM